MDQTDVEEVLGHAGTVNDSKPSEYHGRPNGVVDFGSKARQ
jgi:hypothetical protein